MCVKEEPEYYKLVLNILYVTNCNVINYCAWSCGIGKVSVHNKLATENRKKREKVGNI